MYQKLLLDTNMLMAHLSVTTVLLMVVLMPGFICQAAEWNKTIL